MSLMRDPGTEPLVMISGDVVELTKLVYAEREAHAAEVAELHRLIDTIARVVYPESLSSATFPHLGILQKVIALRDENRKLLAAPPTAAVEAVEGMRKALEKLSRMPDCGCWPCTGQCQSVVALKVELQERCDLACAALAAWKEATRD